MLPVFQRARLVRWIQPLHGGLQTVAGIPAQDHSFGKQADPVTVHLFARNQRGKTDQLGRCQDNRSGEVADIFLVHETISFAAPSLRAAVYGGEGLPDYAEWLVLYRWGCSSGARFLGHVPVGAFTFGADRDDSPPWYPGVAAPFTF